MTEQVVSKTRYVLMIVFSPELDRVVVLFKKRGPDFVRNKRSFPGGHIEEGEAVFAAGTREQLEETGLDVIFWKEVCRKDTDNSEMHVLTATSSDVDQAASLTDEPVEVWRLNDLVLAQARAPQDFAPDLMPLMELARAKLR